MRRNENGVKCFKNSILYFYSPQTQFCFQYLSCRDSYGSGHLEPESEGQGMGGVDRSSVLLQTTQVELISCFFYAQFFY